MEYERLVAEDSKPGLWGFSFDLLVNSRKVQLTDEEEQEIITDLEARLTRLQDGAPNQCEFAAKRLANYYRSRGLEQECNRVVEIWGGAFKCAASQAVGLNASFLLQRAHSIFTQFECSHEAEKVAIEIRERGQEVHSGFKEFTHEAELSHEELKEFVDASLEGNLEQALSYVAFYYVPRKDEIDNHLNEIRHKYIHLFFPTQILDFKGRPIAIVGPLDGDWEGHVICQMAQRLSISCLFLHLLLERAVEKFEITPEVMNSYLFRSPIFSDDQKKILLKGFEEYLDREYMVAIHLLVPQVEATVRNLLEMSGGAVLKSSRSGGFHLRALDELLRSEEIVKSLGNDIALYLRVLLTDPRGWNIRNNLCHGMFRQEDFSKSIADRIVHILLVLAQVRPKKRTREEEQD